MANSPSIALIPSGYKANKIYSVLPTDGSADLTSSRASGATRVNKNGLIEDVATGVPRLDYTNGGCPELLLEPQSTNEITYSEDFTDASWSKSDTTITANAILSPDGSVNASLIDITSGTSDQRISTAINMSGTYSFSVFAKANASHWISLRIGSTANIWFDLQNGVVGSSTITTTFIDASIEDYGNGWYRCTLIYSATGTGVTARIYPADGDLDITHTSGSVYIWGAQLEALSYPTSYIRNSGNTAGVTRIADAVTGATGLGSVINSSEGVLYFEGSGLQDIPSGNLYLSICDGSNSNSIFFRLSTTGALIAYNSGLTSPNNIIAQLSAGSIDLESNFKLSIRWGSTSDDFQLFVNGSKVTQQVGFVFSSLSGMNELIFSLFDGSGNFYGRIRELKVYDTALTDAELTTLTTL